VGEPIHTDGGVREVIPVLETHGLGKRYGRRSALNDCTLSIPPGRLVGLVGPNGAGKSTLLSLACGLIEPTTGSISVLGHRPAADAAQLARVGFVAQDTPIYARLSVAHHLRLGARLNPGWDAELAQRRIKQVGLDPAQKAGKLSGGQRAQLALTLAAAKRPELLIFDEPVASLDPLARRAFLRNLLEFVAELEVSVVLSSHVLSDLEQVCDYLVVLVDSRVQLAGEVDELLAVHYRLAGGRGDFDALPETIEVIQVEHTVRHSSAIVRSNVPLPASIVAEPLTLEEMTLAYLTRAAELTGTGYEEKTLEAQR
jgi:ABC-2 type transport system ATP-binding protein